MTTSTSTHRGTQRRRNAGHGLAGFMIGVLAVAVGVLFARPADSTAPMGAAAQYAEQAAAIRIAIDPNARPSEQGGGSGGDGHQTVGFVPDGESLFSHRHATRILIPSVGLDAEVSPVGLVFRNGMLQYDVPQREAGQYVGSATPGTTGNTIIGGHVARGGVAGVFAALPEVRAGEVIEVYRGDARYRYSITAVKVVAADATQVMSSTQEAILTLITCFPDDGYAERLVVVGKLI